MGIEQNYKHILKQIPADVTLVAVSKTKPIEDIKALYDLGQRDFGENKVQELVDKAEVLPKDIRWHMIGHVQSNKIKYITDFVHLIHGIDKIKYLKEVNKRAKQANRIQQVLLQVKIAEEDSKFGMDIDQVEDVLNSESIRSFEFVKIVGLMGMATFTDNSEQVKSEFKQLYNLFSALKEKYCEIQTLSMGMTGDYEIALEVGSNLVRIGSAIFGARET